MNKHSGIYTITNCLNDKKYIGQSIDLKNRLYQHKHNLKNNKHTNSHLQASFNKHGLNNFKFEVLEYCTLGQLSEREQYWINQHDACNLYNVILDVVNCSMSTETRLKISTANKGKTMPTGKNNPNYGNKWNQEQKRSFALNCKSAKLTENNVLEIKELLLSSLLTDLEIAEKYNVYRTIISRIAKGQIWQTVTGGIILSPEQRKLKSIKRLESTKNKLRIAHTGKRLSQETKDKISKTKKEQFRKNKGN